MHPADGRGGTAPGGVRQGVYPAGLSVPGAAGQNQALSHQPGGEPGNRHGQTGHAGPQPPPAAYGGDPDRLYRSGRGRSDGAAGQAGPCHGH